MLRRRGLRLREVSTYGDHLGNEPLVGAVPGPDIVSDCRKHELARYN